MKHYMMGLLCVFITINPPKKNIRVWMVGDSTMCPYTHDRSPITGWGMPFADFFDSTVSIQNRARGGRSTRTFISEGRWTSVADSLSESDYVLIQFGHNDEAKEPQYKDRYTPVPDYKTNLTRFITETRNKKAIPILITPVTRMSFDANGHIKETHKEYTAAVWEIGKQYDVPVIDLDAASRNLLDELGPKSSKLLFMQLDSLENPHYPTGSHDNTHFNELGARRMAELVLAEIRKQKLELAERIQTPHK
ncbi:MAG: rhamnogalacturonan acetylesterase [Bacteroidetes bacterium]|nr:rhamnogalacturonan acetylesterase [Bacteroidota bacterium]